MPTRSQGPQPGCRPRNINESRIPRMSSPPELLTAAPRFHVQVAVTTRISGTVSGLLCAQKDLIHHARRQLAGIGVLAAGVIAADERLAVRESRGRRHDRTPAGAASPRRAASAAAGTRRRRSSRAPTTTRTSRQRGELRVEVRQAVGDLFRRRLVVGRRAPHGRGDERIASASARRPDDARSGCWRTRRGGAPTSGSRRTRRAPSPVKTRPVRLAPCAAGARPTSSSRARGSPNPGTGLPQ